MVSHVNLYLLNIHIFMCYYCFKVDSYILDLTIVDTYVYSCNRILTCMYIYFSVFYYIKLSYMYMCTNPSDFSSTSRFRNLRMTFPNEQGSFHVDWMYQFITWIFKVWQLFFFYFLVVLVHASLRMRNVRNKITNKMEHVGLKRTPMGIILEGLGQEQEAGS